MISTAVWAQENGNANTKEEREIRSDSVYLNGRSFVVLGDSTIYLEKDTVLVLPISEARKIKRDRDRGSGERFYKSLKEKFYKNKITRELYDILFTEPDRASRQAIKKQQDAQNYAEYSGRPIGDIYIKKLELFGTSITDTTKRSDKWAVKFSNSLHFYTRRHVIRNNIFFKEGDALEADALADSERILRQLPFIKDVRIYVLNGEGEGPVDVLIVVKDQWSITGNLEFSRFDRFDIGITDRNIFGLGHGLKNEFFYDRSHAPELGYSGTYIINNIGHTFIRGEVNYARSQPLDRRSIRVYRDFITPETRLAGGLSITFERNERQKIYRDTTIVFDAEYGIQDFWLGRSVQLPTKREGRKNLQFAGRVARTRFFERPLVRPDTNQLYFDNNVYLFSIGYVKRNYEKSSLITGYGRTEDIPKGFLYEYTVGREFNEFYLRTYMGWRLSFGNYVPRLGYLRPTLSVGGYYRNGKTEQGVVKGELSYFSYLYRIRKLNIRQFFNVSYTVGARRFDDEFININNRNGVRGLSNVFLRGTRKLTFMSETVIFTPVYFLGFRLATYAFADLAVINLNDAELLSNDIYQGYGIGFRLRNENLVINAIQIRLAWYPRTPDNLLPYDIDLSGQAFLNLQDFRVEQPSVIEFR